MQEERRLDESLFLLLTALFVAALVICNVIANKFVTVDLGFKTFTISAGILPYPITFLVTDILSEIYGRRRANQVVIAGFFGSLFVLLAIWLGGAFAAIPKSPVDDAAYIKVFGNTWRVIAASMVAYLTAQLIDIRIFHFWKRVTRGNHLWLRNNASTIFSQLVDSALVVLVLFVGVKTSTEMGQFILDAWMFKAMLALLDTPLCYLAVWWLRRRGISPAPHDE